MSESRQLSRPSLEVVDARPAVHVHEAEYWRLLGYPPNHSPGERPRELAACAREWYAAQGRPWVYLREAELQVTADSLRIDGVDFQSQKLREHLLECGAQRAMLVAVSAGAACEEHARQLWQESKPDEYFFLEILGSAVVEQLVATLSGRICDLAERDGLMAVPHYSPGYTGWDIAEQTKLFDLISGGSSQPFPESLEVLGSGMLKPKKSLLAVVGLAPRREPAPGVAPRVPCETCSFSPCQYRRLPYRHAVAPELPARPTDLPLARNATYTVNARALKKWAQERVRLERRDDGSVGASFRFDGTTCSNQGRPLAFNYTVTLSAPEEDYTILQADCRPAPDDTGHSHMCAYIDDPGALMGAISSENPLIGRPLGDVLDWKRTAAPSGCYCTAESRAHKWGLALEAIHYALAHAANGNGFSPAPAARPQTNGTAPFSPSS